MMTIKYVWFLEWEREDLGFGLDFGGRGGLREEINEKRGERNVEMESQKARGWKMQTTQVKM